MDRLPPELICQLCECLSHADLKRVRLVNRACEAASTPLVFDHLFVALFPDSVDRLAALSRSRLAKHVTAFTLLADTLPQLSRIDHNAAIDFAPPYREWRDSLPADEREALSSIDNGGNLYTMPIQYHRLRKAPFTTTQIRESYLAYGAARRDQRSWPERGNDLSFRESFAKLPNVRSAHVKCARGFDETSNMLPFWRTLRQRILVGPRDWWGKLESCDLESSKTAVLGFLDVVAFRASISGIKQITTLSILTAQMEWPSSLWSPRQDGHSRAGAGTPLSYRQPRVPLADAFANVTDLHVHTPYEIVKYLRFATRLRRLSFRYDHDDLTAVHTLLREATWPNLKDLLLAADAPTELLIPFLARHASTLQSLKLRDMRVNNVDSVIDQLPKILELKSIYLENLSDGSDSVGLFDDDPPSILSHGTDFDAPYEKSVKAYLLGETDKMPEIVRERDQEFLNDVDESREDDVGDSQEDEVDDDLPYDFGDSEAYGFYDSEGGDVESSDDEY